MLIGAKIKTPCMMVQGATAEVIELQPGDQWRRVRDLNPSYAINVNTISSRGYGARRKPYSTTHLNTLIPAQH